MAKEENNVSDVVKKAYELAYLLVPQLADEAAVASVASIVKEIETLGGSLIAQDGPEMRELAYTISRVQTGKRTDFDSAYFGWIRFDLPTESSTSLKEWIRQNKEIIRSITLSVSRSAPVSASRKVPRRSATTVTKTESEKPELTSEEIDKEVEQLIAATAE